jgi:FlaG/FlaF family flagellin (archaellin)
MKGLSQLIAVVLLILITFITVLIINAWTRETVTNLLTESFDNYKRVVGSIAESIFNLFK